MSETASTRLPPSEVKKDREKLIIVIALLVVAIAVLFVTMIPVDAICSKAEPYYRECQYEVVLATLIES